MAEALTHNIFEVAASWMPMMMAAEAHNNEAFLDAFKARTETARKRNARLRPGSERKAS